MKDLGARWLSRAFQLAAFAVVSATVLRALDKIGPSDWTQVITIVVPAWFVLNGVEKWRKPQ